MDLLVTGGCGYIGSALVPMLTADGAVDRVVVLDSLTSGSPRALLGSLTPDAGETDAGETDDGVDFRRGDVREYGDVESASLACGPGFD
jgi:nucleoside-diphosphate-sugar epimerase